MTMKYLLFILCLSLSLVAQAQEKVDSLSKKQNNSEMSVSISVDNLSRLENEKKEAVQNNKDLQHIVLPIFRQGLTLFCQPGEHADYSERTLVLANSRGARCPLGVLDKRAA